MMNLFKIVKNELKTMITDPGTILIMFCGFFMYGLFYTIPFATHVLKQVPIGVIDYDNSSISREFIRDLNSNEYLHVVSRPVDIDDAKEQYYQNKIRAYVIIPKDFERDIYRGGHSFISSYEDSAFLIIYKQVATGVMTTSLSLGAKVEIGSFMKKGLSKQQAMSIKLPFEFVQIPLYNPAASYQNYIYPLVLILILQQTMLVGVGLLGGTLKEKLRGFKKWTKEGFIETKLEKVCEFSNNPAEIVLGKGLAYFGLYFVYSLFCFLIFPAYLAYDMTYNMSMFLILIPFLFSITFLAQAMIYFYSERENSLFILIATSVPMIFLPGFVWPKECIPVWLAVFSKLIPATSAMDGLTRINQMGASFWQVQTDFWVLIALCVLYFYLACKVTKNMQASK